MGLHTYTAIIFIFILIFMSLAYVKRYAIIITILSTEKECIAKKAI